MKKNKKEYPSFIQGKAKPSQASVLYPSNVSNGGIRQT
jgi:hypothetical protein